MEISNIQIVPVPPQNGLVGFVSFTIDNKWHVSNIALYTRPHGGYRLVYPNKKVGSTYQTIFNPIDKSIGLFVEQTVIDKANDLFGTPTNF